MSVAWSADNSVAVEAGRKLTTTSSTEETTSTPNRAKTNRNKTRDHMSSKVQLRRTNPMGSDKTQRDEETAEPQPHTTEIQTNSLGNRLCNSLSALLGARHAWPFT